MRIALRIPLSVSYECLHVPGCLRNNDAANEDEQNRNRQAHHPDTNRDDQCCEQMGKPVGTQCERSVSGSEPSTSIIPIPATAQNTRATSPRRVMPDDQHRCISLVEVAMIPWLDTCWLTLGNVPAATVGKGVTGVHAMRTLRVLPGLRSHLAWVSVPYLNRSLRYPLQLGGTELAEQRKTAIPLAVLETKPTYHH